MPENIINRLLIGTSLGLISALLIFLFTEVLFPTVFDNFEYQTLDQRYSHKINKLEEARSGDKIEEIVIVDIDNRSLNKLGRFQQWPRDYYADIMVYLAESEAMAIGFDILFMEEDIDRVADTLLVTATRLSESIIHALSFSRAEPDAFLYKMNFAPEGLNTEKFSYNFSQPILDHFPEAERFDGKFTELYNVSARLGFANYQPDNDSVIRKMPLFMNFAGRLYPSLAMAMVFHLFNIESEHIKIEPGKSVRLTLQKENEETFFDIPIDQQGQMLINYTGTFQTFRYVSFYDVYMKRIPKDFFKGKIVLVGASAPGLEDIRPVPFQEAFPGVEIHANILHNILNHDFVHQKSKLTSNFMLLLLCLIVGITSAFFPMKFSVPILFTVAAGFIYSTFYAFVQNSIWIENVRPFLGIMLSQVAVLGYKYFTELKDKKRIKGMFQNYLSPTVVNELLKNPKLLELGGERKIATAFFSDIKNFTTFSEKLEPEQLVTYLNEYLSALSEVILKYEGYIDKYEGDAIVAFFGIPIEQRDHGLRACYAALEIQNRLIQLRNKWKKQGKPLFETRIGINSGPMIAGNIGGANRFDYTAIGDSVNLASRLEGANKIYGTNIIISESTFRLTTKNFWCRELDHIRVKGKSKPVRIYEIIGNKNEVLGNVQKAYLEYYLRGLESYRKKDFNLALEFFQKALTIYPADEPSNEFSRRCKFNIKNPVPTDWDPVFDLKSK